jgi:hypothetical protein
MLLQPEVGIGKHPVERSCAQWVYSMRISFFSLGGFARSEGQPSCSS